jgi:multisubunit Na+/H+ antiporter MnhG subunit
MEIRPRLLAHAFDSDSKSVTFGWSLKVLATILYFARQDFGAERWERMVLIAAFLVAGKLVKEAYLDGKAPGDPK